MSIKSNRKDHLGKGISSLLGNFSYDMADELLGELEKNKQKHEEEQMPEPVKEKPAEKIIPKIAEVKPVEIKPAETKVIDENQVLYVSIDNIQVNPDQPRKAFDENSLQELAESVRKQGILQPLLVEEFAPGKFSIIAGERRYRAARIAGLDKIPVLVRRLNEIQRIEVALIENIQREDLNPVDEAAAYQFLIQKSGLTQEEIAKRVGKNRSTITNSLRLLQLPDSIKDDLVSGLITAGHARAILSCINPSDRIILRNRIVDKELSVRAAEAEAEALNQGKKLILKKKASQKNKDAEIISIEDKFLMAFGTHVEVKGSARRGKLIIPYSTTRELERIYALLKDDQLFDEE